MTKLWLNSFTALLIMPAPKSVKYFDLNPGVLVENNPQPSDPPGLACVNYTNAEGKEFTGWIKSDCLEPYIENFPKNCVQIEGQTPNKNDAEQYFVYQGQKQVNACGELCVAYILGEPLAAILATWKVKSPPLWKSIIGQGRMRGTGSGELRNLLEIYDQKPVELSSILKRYTPASLKNWVEHGHVIASCNIDSTNGRLRGAGVLHWVVVTEVLPERQWGTVRVYNPYPNRIEEYSWMEFVNSAHQPYGVFVK